MASLSDLGQKVKAKYPGKYDDLSDADLGRRVQARFPGKYDDFADDAPAAQTVPSHTPGETVQRDIQATDLVTGPVEGALTLGTGMLAYPAGLAAGAASLALGRGKEPLDVDAAREWRQKTQQALTYSPRTESGQGFVGAVDRALQPWTRSAQYVGEGVGEATGSPTAGGVAEEVFGAVVNPLTPMLWARGLRRTQTVIPPRLQIRPEAKALASHGVRDLTAGQMAPAESFPAILERVSADHPLGLRPQRDAAKESFMRAAQDKGTAPGATPPSSTDLQARLRELYAGFEKPYEQIGATPIDAASIASMPERAMQLPGADSATRVKVANEVGNALTVVPGVNWQPPGMHGDGHLSVKGLTREPIGYVQNIESAAAGVLPQPVPSPFALRRDQPAAPVGTSNVWLRNDLPVTREPVPSQRTVSVPRPLPESVASGGQGRLIPGTNRPAPNSGWQPVFSEPPPMTAGDLLRARSNIRELIRAARQAQDFDRIRLLEHAEDVVTGSLESGLTPESAALLRATDRQYARLATAANAAPAGQTTFTPGQFLRQVEKSSGRRAFKQGGAGDLQDLGEAARGVFAEAPMTGFRPGVLSALPGAKYWGAPVSRALNSPAGRRFLFDPRVRYGLTGSPDPLVAALAEAMSVTAQSPLGIPRLRLGTAAAHDQEKDR